MMDGLWMEYCLYEMLMAIKIGRCYEEKKYPTCCGWRWYVTQHLRARGQEFPHQYYLFRSVLRSRENSQESHPASRDVPLLQGDIHRAYRHVLRNGPHR